MPDPVKDDKISVQEKKDWNEYIDYLSKKGLKGSPELNKGAGEENVGRKVLKQFLKENPTSSLRIEKVPKIQNYFEDLQKSGKERLESGKSKMAEGQTKESFMKGISKVDIYPGSKTTTYKFPTASLETSENGKIISKQELGFTEPGVDPYKSARAASKEEMTTPTSAEIKKGSTLDEKPKSIAKEMPKEARYYASSFADNAFVGVKDLKTGAVKKISKVDWKKVEGNPVEMEKIMNK